MLLKGTAPANGCLHLGVREPTYVILQQVHPWTTDNLKSHNSHTTRTNVQTSRWGVVRVLAERTGPYLFGYSHEVVYSSYIFAASFLLQVLLSNHLNTLTSCLTAAFSPVIVSIRTQTQNKVILSIRNFCSNLRWNTTRRRQWRAFQRIHINDQHWSGFANTYGLHACMCICPYLHVRKCMYICLSEAHVSAHMHESRNLCSPFKEPPKRTESGLNFHNSTSKTNQNKFETRNNSQEDDKTALPKHTPLLQMETKQVLLTADHICRHSENTNKKAKLYSQNAEGSNNDELLGCPCLPVFCCKSAVTVEATFWNCGHCNSVTDSQTLIANTGDNEWCFTTRHCKCAVSVPSRHYCMTSVTSHQKSTA